MGNKACFWDRDGVLNELVYRGGTEYTSPWDISELRYKEGALEAVNSARDAGFLNLIISNQPGVHEHHIIVEELVRINNAVKAWFRITDSRMALFKDDHGYYKPGHGMILELAQKHDVELKKSFLVGDRFKDIVAGYNAGLTTIFLGSYYWAPPQYHGIMPNYIADNLEAVASIICEKQ